MIEITLAIYYLFALLTAFFLIKAYHRGTIIGQKLGRAMLMNFLMILAYTVNLSFSNSFAKSLGCSVTFIFMDLMLFFYYDYTLAFIGWNQKVTRWIQEIFCAYIVIDGIFMLMNPFNEVALSYVREAWGDGYILTYVPRIPFHGHMVFNFLMMAVIIILLLFKCWEAPKVYRNRYFGSILGMLLSVVIQFIYLAGVIPLPMDPTLLLYVFVGLLLYFYTFNYLPGVTIALTKNMIFKYIENPIILFDYEGHLVDYSDLVKTLMPDCSFKPGELTIDRFVKENNFLGMAGTDKNQEFDWTWEQDGMVHIYQCQFCCMKDEQDKLLGKLFVFHDETNSRQTFFELEKSMLYDYVTGFYNKQSFYTQIPQWSDSDYWPVSFVVCNVDGMNAINEAYGTAYGDGVIRQLARHIRRRVGEQVFCAKLDNGDIVVALEGVSNADAGDMFEELKKEIFYFYKNMPMSVTIEYGVATKNDGDTPVEKVLQDARMSMQNKKMLKEKSASSSIVDSLKQTLCESDYQTEEHVERTREMAARLGHEMDLSDSDIGRLELLAVLHDIGKVAIPQNIIKKEGKLTPEERAIVEQHTEKGYRIAKSSPELSDIAEGILSHHEKWDGTGYPNGLKGEEIPLIARVISAVDAHDVMVNDRPYHKAMLESEAIEELKRCSGTQFDPTVIKYFIALLEREEIPKEAARMAAEKENAEKENAEKGNAGK